MSVIRGQMAHIQKIEPVWQCFTGLQFFLPRNNFWEWELFQNKSHKYVNTPRQMSIQSTPAGTMIPPM